MDWRAGGIPHKSDAIAQKVKDKQADEKEHAEHTLRMSYEKIHPPMYALHGALMCLKNIYSIEDDSWKRVRDQVKVGIIKDTVSHGNTSVSMGAATLVFGLENLPRVCFLNCGTGGIKYQVYQNRVQGDADTYINVTSEYKPAELARSGKDDVVFAKFSDMVCGKYPERLKESERKKITHPQTKEQIESYIKKELEKSGLDSSIPKYAFITGSIRSFYEDNKEDRTEMDEIVSSVFDKLNIKPLPLKLGDKCSFFLPQASEGALELLGTRKMYENLYLDNLFPDKPEVICSFGIGAGTIQFTIYDHERKTEPYVINLKDHDCGMLRNHGNFGIEKLVHTLGQVIPDMLASMHSTRKGAALTVVKPGPCPDNNRVGSKDVSPLELLLQNIER